MKHYVGAGIVAAAALFVAAPSSAAVLTIDNNNCVSVLEADGGCVFFGNDNDVGEIETVYNATTKAGVPIDLRLIGKIDAPDTTASFGSITYDVGGMSGT